MSGFQFAARTVRRWIPIVLWTSGLTAQTCLVLSPPAITPDGVALLDLTLYSFRRATPAVVQWTFQFPPSSVGSLTVDDGPALTSAGKTTICSVDATAYNCLASGLNTNTIASGVIAKVTATLAPGANAATIRIASALGAAADGSPIPIHSLIVPMGGNRVSVDCRPLPRPGASLGGK